MRRMGGLAKKIPHHLRTMLIGSLAIAGHPAAGRLLLQGRDPRRGVQARLPVGLGDRPRRRGHDRVLHVPADRPDVLGREPGRPATSSRRSTSRRRSMTMPLILLAIPSVCPRASSLGPAARGRACIHQLARAGLPRGDRSSLGHAEARVPAVRHRRRPDPRERRGRGDRRSPSPGACSASSSAAIRLRAAARSASGASTRARPVPLPRVAQQVVVRRPQPPAVHRHRRPRRGVPVVVRPARRRRHRQRHRRADAVGAARGLRRVQTGRVQNYALGIAIGLIVMAGSYLVPGGPLMTIELDSRS